MNSKHKSEEGLFRKKSIERLSSPEQLDRLMVVISAKGWISLWCLILLIAAFLIWAFVGSIPVQVSGTGILLPEKGLFNIQSNQEGVVVRIPAELGQNITSSQPVVILADSAHMKKIREAKDKNHLLQEALKKSKEKGDKGEIDQLQDELDKSNANVQALESNDANINVYSNVEGKIFEIDVSPGDIVKSGQSIAWLIEPLNSGETLFCYSYLPISSGEKVQTGMKAEMALGNVDTGTYGYLLGEVAHLSALPVSDQDIIHRVHNPQLVNYLKRGQAAVIAAVIKPFPDSETASGYLWSTPKGPPAPPKSGSICDVQINIEVRRPITYLLPFLQTKEQPPNKTAQ
jgi:biotin carboxyl carrier protein